MYDDLATIVYMSPEAMTATNHYLLCSVYQSGIISARSQLRSFLRVFGSVATTPSPGYGPCTSSPSAKSTPSSTSALTGTVSVWPAAAGTCSWHSLCTLHGLNGVIGQLCAANDLPSCMNPSKATSLLRFESCQERWWVPSFLTNSHENFTYVMLRGIGGGAVF